MTTTFLYPLIDKIARKVDNFNGEPCTFDVEHNDWVAECRYTATIGEDAGDRWTAPSWWVESEQVEVLKLYNADGDEEPTLRKWVEKQLN